MFPNLLLGRDNFSRVKKSVEKTILKESTASADFHPKFLCIPVCLSQTAVSRHPMSAVAYRNNIGNGTNT